MKYKFDSREFYCKKCKKLVVGNFQKNKIFCSKQCKDNSYNYYNFFCKQCGKSANSTKKSSIYCSLICRIDSTRITQKEKSERSILIFEKNVIKKEGCWGWIGNITPKGYARIATKFEKECLGHRISYIIHKGKIPDGLNILHSCHNPTCTNPDHLRIGTHKENMKDKCDAFRQHFKVSKQKVIAIKIILKEDKFSLDEISKMFNTSMNCVIAIKRKII